MHHRSRSRWKAVFPALVWSGLLYFILIRPLPDLPKAAIPGMDKAVHFTLFGIETLLLYAALVSLRQDDRGRLLPAVLSALLAFCYSLYLEALQSTIPERSAELADLIANGLGVLGALLGIAIVIHRLEGGWKMASIGWKPRG